MYEAEYHSSAMNWMIIKITQIISAPDTANANTNVNTIDIRNMAVAATRTGSNLKFLKYSVNRFYHVFALSDGSNQESSGAEGEQVSKRVQHRECNQITQKQYKCAL